MTCALSPVMADSPVRDQTRRGSGMETFISGRLPQKLSDSLFPGPDRAQTQRGWEAKEEKEAFSKSFCLLTTNYDAC